MGPALSSTILKFLHFFPASLQAKTAVISKLLMIRLVLSFKLKTSLNLSLWVIHNFHSVQKLQIWSKLHETFFTKDFMYVQLIATNVLPSPFGWLIPEATCLFTFFSRYYYLCEKSVNMIVQLSFSRDLVPARLNWLRVYVSFG